MIFFLKITKNSKNLQHKLAMIKGEGKTGEHVMITSKVIKSRISTMSYVFGKEQSNGPKGQRLKSKTGETSQTWGMRY